MVDQGPYFTNCVIVFNSVAIVQQTSEHKFISSLIDLLNHQQAMQKDTTAVIFKLSHLQSKYKNNHFLVNLQTYDEKK